jgi:nucleoside-diphosphate-sugar epimerase
VVVTGASGFIGRSLQPALARAGHEVIPLDVRNRAFADGEAIVHLAGIAHRRATPQELYRANVQLAEDIGRRAAANGSALVFLSSVKVHGERASAPLTEGSPIAPGDAYARTKAQAEEALRAIPGLRLAVLRPPLVYGPGVKANFLALMSALARGVPLPFASIRNRRSFVYVGNLVEAIVRCVGHEGIYLVSDGEAVSTPELCRRLGEALERPARLVPFPAALLPEKLTASLEVDDAMLRRTLHWHPAWDMSEGLRATAQWYRGG